MALAGASLATIESALITARDTTCEDPDSLSDAEVKATAASAYRSANMDEGKKQILPEPMTIGELHDQPFSSNRLLWCVWDGVLMSSALPIRIATAAAASRRCVEDASGSLAGAVLEGLDVTQSVQIGFLEA
jgi:hypothetical protein